ncbi:MAG: DUF362 domain-containing protein [Desulfovibrionaceae bacterium]
MHPSVPFAVPMARMLEYESTLLEAAVGLLLNETGFAPEPGMRVLVKPNLVSRVNAKLSCTHPLVVRAACVWLLERNARVTVADSPAFGSALQVARAAGLDKALAPLGLQVRDLDKPEPLRLSFGGEIGISGMALHADAILNVPRLKAHCQMRLTGAVKNLFGCVTGWRKAVAHARHGDQGRRFRSLLLEVALTLPKTYSLLDAIRPMHRTGPVKGDPFDLGLLAACADPIALDTAVYSLLDLVPEQVPLWAEALQQSLPGADPANLYYPVELPEEFNTDGFLLPEELEPESFHPLRLARGRVRSFLERLGWRS